MSAALVALAATGAGFLLGNAHAQARPQAIASAASSGAASSAEAVSPAPSATPAAAVAPQPAAPAPQPIANANPNDPDQMLGQLFQMATELKTEVGKTNQEVLSVAVVRKAAAIEQLAHKVRTGGAAK